MCVQHIGHLVVGSGLHVQEGWSQNLYAGSNLGCTPSQHQREWNIRWWIRAPDLLVGMLGEAVKNPEMAQRYVNTHTHTQHTRVQKHILFKNSFKILILVVFEIQKIKNHFKYTVITLDFVFIHSWCRSSTMKCYCIISGKTPKIKYSKICNFWTVNSITVIFFPLSLIFFSLSISMNLVLR